MTAITVPPQAFACTTEELDAFETERPSDWIGRIELVRVKCRGRFSDEDDDGYLLPSTTEGTTYLAGWFAGRRSVRRMAREKETANRTASKAPRRKVRDNSQAVGSRHG